MAARKPAEAPMTEQEQCARRTGELLSKEPRVRIQLPAAGEEGSAVPVGINGYFYRIRRGVTVEVPQSVADLLTNAGYL